MKKIVVILVVLSWALLSGAQSQFTLKANIPFDFIVGSQLAPAGEYTFVLDSSKRVLVRPMALGLSGKQVQVAELDIFFKGEDAKIVFHQVGQRYFLTELKHPGAARVVLAPNPAERKLQTVAGKQVEIDAEAGR